MLQVSSALALLKYSVVSLSQSTALVNRAHRVFQSAIFSPGYYHEATNITQDAATLEEFFPSFDFADDLFWASTWLYRAATNNIRSSNFTYYKEAMVVTSNLACAFLQCLFTCTHMP